MHTSDALCCMPIAVTLRSPCCLQLKIETQKSDKGLTLLIPQHRLL